uniref:peptidoglycan lytic exotransglycosylase n=1 Tax=Candidatus Kentrum sp. LFY TaxID=2126342 RepID=A0A450X5I0_9GAMM|nr:MAG: membrane-bound lytic murein transglycosylase A [Candidatus Kentron sp. LFY]
MGVIDGPIDGRREGLAYSTIRHILHRSVFPNPTFSGPPRRIALPVNNEMESMMRIFWFWPRRTDFRMILGNVVALMVAALLLGACARMPAPPSPSPPSPRFTLHPVTYGELPGWESDHHGEILPVFLRSCEKIVGYPPTRDFGPRVEMGKVDHWISLCQEAGRIDPGDKGQVRHFLERGFTPYAVGVGDRGDHRGDDGWTGLFTGYYEPELRGSLQADARFRYPILARPDDLISVDLGHLDDKRRNRRIVGRISEGRLVPYYDRAEIEAGALAGRGLEILWLDDPTDAFFLHIQGSGRALLPDGSYLRLGYAGQNGRPYTAIGRKLVASGEMALEEVSMPTVRMWIEANPASGAELMRSNRAYVFFRIRKPDVRIDGQFDGPIGAQGVVLTPRRSLAVDPDYIPLGTPLWLVTLDPGSDPSRPLRRLVIAQDTGSAIRGAVRGDLFWGSGKKAGDKAGIMREQGHYYLLLPRTAALLPTKKL